MSLHSSNKIQFSFHFRYCVYTLSDDMIYMQILFSFTEIGAVKLCYFVKQGYLNNYPRYCFEILYDNFVCILLGKRVSDLLFMY